MVRGWLAENRSRLWAGWVARHRAMLTASAGVITSHSPSVARMTNSSLGVKPNERTCSHTVARE